MLWLWLGTFGGYGLVAALTARLTLERCRARFLRSVIGGLDHEGPVAEFERRERHQVEAIALLCGVCWVVALPVVALKLAVLRLVLARPRPDASRRGRNVQESIDELERTLGIGAYAEGPQEDRSRAG